MKKLLLLSLFLTTTFAFGQITEMDRSFYSDRNILLNPGFEGGESAWLESVSSNLTATTTAANVLIGKASGSIQISTNGGYVRSRTVQLPVALYGQACEVRVLYKGGDALTTLEVYNRDNELLGSLALTAHTSASYESVPFLCPSATAIAGDADKGFLYTQIKQTSAGTHTVLYADEWYMGRLKNLIETTLPDMFSAKISSADAVSAENVDWINGNCTNASTGVQTCNFVSGIFSNTPNCVAVINEANAYIVEIGSISSSAITINTVNQGVGLVNAATQLFCMKSGSDARQTAQTYKSIPMVSDNINNFTVKVSSADVVSDENTEWISGDCTNATTGKATCTYDASVFSVTPNCTATASSATDGRIVTIEAESASAITITTTDDAGALANIGFTLSCQKQGVDFKTPIVQPIVVGQIETGSTTVERSFSADLNCDASSAVTSSNLSGLSIGNRSTTTCAVTVPSGFFSAAPRCTFTVKATTVQATAVNPTSATAIAIYGPSADYDGTLTCWGSK